MYIYYFWFSWYSVGNHIENNVICKTTNKYSMNGSHHV